MPPGRTAASKSPSFESMVKRTLTSSPFVWVVAPDWALDNLRTGPDWMNKTRFRDRGRGPIRCLWFVTVRKRLGLTLEQEKPIDNYSYFIIYF